MRSRHTQASNIGAHSEQEGGKETYIGIFSVDTGRRDDPGLLLVFIEDNRVGFNGISDDLEACLVGDTVAVSEGGGSWMRRPRHNMGQGTEKRRDEVGGGGRWGGNGAWRGLRPVEVWRAEAWEGARDSHFGCLHNTVGAEITKLPFSERAVPAPGQSPTLKAGSSDGAHECG